MNEKNYTTEAEEREQTISAGMRYTYIGSRVEIDGVGYPVVAAIPLGTAEIQLKTAEEKMLRLVEGN